jgi:hypothetical protein
MALELLDTDGGKILHVKASGRISKEEYDCYLAALDARIRQHGKVRLLFEIDHYQGLELGAWWDDTKWGVQHGGRGIERVALVGAHPKWWDVAGKIAGPLTGIKNRSFEAGQEEDARRWIESDGE